MFASLPLQVANALRQEIAAGIWRDWLPGERQLVEQLKISRKTLRKALKQLEIERLIQTHRGAGHQILERPGRISTPAPDHTVGLVLPEPLELQRPFTTRWVAAMRELLADQKVRLRIFNGQKFRPPSAAAGLAKLTSRAPQNCWVLAQSNLPAQQWFARNALPCVIAGSVHPGLTLPNVDLDYYALCRHAALTIRRQGHIAAAFLVTASETAGDLQSRRGFLDGMDDPGKELRAVISRHDGTAGGVKLAVDRLLAMPRRPTALLVANPNYYLSALSAFASRKLRIPEDISLVSRDDDPALHYLLPEPARYSCDPALFAGHIGKAVLSVIRAEALTRSTIRIMPKFIPGGSLGPPRSP